MLEKFLNRWKRKGNRNRLVELVVMGVAASVAKAVCDYFQFDNETTKVVVETVSMIVAAYLAKLAAPTEPAVK